MRSRTRPRRGLSLFLVGLAGWLVLGAPVACKKAAPPVDPAYRAKIEQWRAKRLARLTSENGWLTLVGLYWLHPGDNRFGSSDKDEVVLHAAGVPPVAGILELRKDGSVVVHAEAGVPISEDGKPVGERPLRSDASDHPDVLELAGLHFYLIDRAGAIAVRVKDPHSPARLHFPGIEDFPVNPEYRVVGRFERYATARPVKVASAQGPSQDMLVPGVVRFTVAGKACSLEPFVSSPDDRDFFFVFRDETTGRETYGAGRFLDTSAPQEGGDSVVLDFNQAYNPPCAFTPYATCPLPPRQNSLSVRIEAGEKFSGHHA
jgi:uncharacterized protein